MSAAGWPEMAATRDKDKLNSIMIVVPGSLGIWRRVEMKKKGRKRKRERESDVEREKTGLSGCSWRSTPRARRWGGDTCQKCIHWCSAAPRGARAPALFVSGHTQHEVSDFWLPHPKNTTIIFTIGAESAKRSVRSNRPTRPMFEFRNSFLFLPCSSMGARRARSGKLEGYANVLYWQSLRTLMFCR